MRRLLILLVLLFPATAAATPPPASWVANALGTQYELGSTLPLRNAPWIGTHNSFNSSSEPPTLSGLDNNQSLSLPDQLDAGVRSLELDAHLIGGKVLACHGRGADEAHLGCTNERPLAARLQEIDGWLAAHPGQVVLLYLEDHMESVAGYDLGAQAVKDTLGPRVYAPPATGACTPMPLELTRNQMRAAGKQVLIISGCGPDGSAWPTVAWDDKERADNESGDPAKFKPYPACDPDRDQAFYAQHFVRYYEDSTHLSAGVGFVDGSTPSPITPAVAAAMARCGVDLTGFDQLTAQDPRLAASVWSYAPNEPAAGVGPCTVEKTGGRWRAARCAARHAFACRDAAGTWTIDKRYAPYRRARKRCPGPGRLGVPRTGLEAQQLRTAIKAAGVRVAWIRLKR